VDTKRAVAHVATWPLAAAAGVLGGIAVEPLIEGLAYETTAWPPTTAPWVVAAVTAALSALACAFALRGRTHVELRTLAACVTLGVVNAPLCVAVLTVPSSVSDAPAWLGRSIGIGLFALFVSAPLGMAYGVVGLFPMRLLHRLRSRPTVQSAARAAVVVGSTLVVTCAFGALVATDGHDVRRIGPFAPLVLAALGAVMVGGGGGWTLMHRRWLRRVRDGRVAGWRIVEPSRLPDGAAAEDLPVDPAGFSGVLVRVVPDSTPSAYRTATVHVSWTRLVVR
jgi:hypothetical protein